MVFVCKDDLKSNWRTENGICILTLLFTNEVKKVKMRRKGGAQT